MALETEHVLQVYKRNPVVFERGRGCRLFDARRPRLPRPRSLASASRRSGTRNPRLAAALAEQAATLLHTSNLFFHPLQGEVATRLVGLVGAAARVLLQQRRGSGRGLPEVRAPLLVSRENAPRPGLVAFEHSFHGRTMGALSVTWDDHYRAPFAPLLPGVQFVSPNDPDALLAAVTRIDRRGHPRAAAGRRRRPAVQPAHGGRGRPRRAAGRARSSSPTRSSAGSDGPAVRSTRRRSGSSRT